MNKKVSPVTRQLSRRTFLSTSAKAAAAISASGLLVWRRDHRTVSGGTGKMPAYQHLLQAFAMVGL